MRPGAGPAPVRLLEAAAFDVFLGTWFKERHGAVLVPVVEATVGQGNGAFRCLPGVPQDLTCLEIKAHQEAAFVATVGSVQATIQEDHAAVVVLHFPGMVNFLSLDPAVSVL